MIENRTRRIVTAWRASFFFFRTKRPDKHPSIENHRSRLGSAIKLRDAFRSRFYIEKPGETFINLARPPFFSNESRRSRSNKQTSDGVNVVRYYVIAFAIIIIYHRYATKEHRVEIDYRKIKKLSDWRR